MTYEKIPNQTGQNFPVSPQYATFPGSAVGFPASPQYGTFPESGAAPASTPLTILGAPGMYYWFRSDLGITIGTGVSAWADQSGPGDDASQSTIALQPAYGATQLNGVNVISFDGTDDLLENAVAPVFLAPATTPLFVWFVFRQDNWVASDRIYCAASNNRL